MTSAEDVQERLLTFWFGRIGGPTTAAETEERGRLWFTRNPAVDADLRDRFGADVERAARGELAELGTTPRGRLTLVLLLDQLPRNIYRDTARAFATDPAALQVTLDGLAVGADAELSITERWMFYMPLMHAEDAAAQERSMDLFRKLRADAGQDLAEVIGTVLGFADRHREIIERFGRYPHRNAILGRTSTPEEVAFLKEPNSSF